MSETFKGQNKFLPIQERRLKFHIQLHIAIIMKIELTLLLFHVAVSLVCLVQPLMGPEVRSRAHLGDLILFHLIL